MVLFGTQGEAVMVEASQTMPSSTPSGQLSDPFNKMCLLSQMPMQMGDAPSQRPPVPLFSQAAPTTSQEMNGGGSGEGPEVYGSQIDILGTQDFITPADQFDLEYDPAAAGGRERTPAQLSPNRIKRARKNNSERDDATLVSLPSLGVPPGPPGRAGGANFYAPPAPRRQISRVQSPPCYRNMFLHDNENEQDSYKQWRTSRPAPSTQLSRFRIDFKELGCIGQGSFSKVFRARHRIDGSMYAVKRTIKEVTDEHPEFLQFLQEAQVYAHLTRHPGIVGYYGCWTEAGLEGGERLFMQLELCDVSLETHVGLGERMAEAEILELARQVAAALDHLHSQGVAHLDVKPSNVYLKYPPEGETGGGGCSTSDSHVVYKLGDFGQATKLNIGKGEGTVNEGDSRYLPLELLNEDYSALDKADIFSLGAMLFELATGRELPSGGQTYEDLRKGRVPLLPTATHPFMKLIRALLSPDPKDRPSAAKLLQMAPLAKRSLNGVASQ